MTLKRTLKKLKLAALIYVLFLITGCASGPMYSEPISGEFTNVKIPMPLYTKINNVFGGHTVFYNVTYISRIDEDGCIIDSRNVGVDLYKREGIAVPSNQFIYIGTEHYNGRVNCSAGGVVFLETGSEYVVKSRSNLALSSGSCSTTIFRINASAQLEPVRLQKIHSKNFLKACMVKEIAQDTETSSE